MKQYRLPKISYNKQGVSMHSFKNSVILMGIDWSKAAKKIANKEISVECKDLNKVIEDLDEDYRTKKLR